MNDPTEATRAVVREYHRKWTTGDLSYRFLVRENAEFVGPPAIETDGGTLTYARTYDWPEGVSVDLVAELVDGEQAVQIYDATSPNGVTVRIVEHLTVRDGLIVRLAPLCDLTIFGRFMAVE